VTHKPIDIVGIDPLTDPRLVLVGVGELACAREPSVLVTQALGSCIGLALWDPRLRIGGMAHVMLPASPDGELTGRRHRFADLAVPELIEQMVAMGAGRHRMFAKIAGGSSMFKGDSGMDSIGGRNAVAVIEQLERAGLAVCASDTGGSHARTIELHLDTGTLMVRSYSFGMREI
jgi:chemotaxis protein CheD